MSIKNGDMPASPTAPILDDSVGRAVDVWQTSNGLTKREMFAMAAMQGLCATSNSDGEWQHDAVIVAQHAVDYADELLKALETEPQQ